MLPSIIRQSGEIAVTGRFGEPTHTVNPGLAESSLGVCCNESADNDHLKATSGPLETLRMTQESTNNVLTPSIHPRSSAAVATATIYKA